MKKLRAMNFSPTFFKTYERYSFAGNNRLSLSPNMISDSNSNVNKVTAIGNRGSIATF